MNTTTLTHFMRLLLTLAVSVVFGVGMVACSGDDDNGSAAAVADDDTNDDDDNTAAEYASCDESVSELTDTDEESTLIGAAASDAIAAFEGPLTATASWSSETSSLTQSPSGTDTELTLTVTYDGGDIREVESTPKEPEEGEVMNDMAVICLHRIEVDVTVSVVTDDGGLDETLDAVLVLAQSMDMAGLDEPKLSADVDLDALTGTFEIVSFEGGEPDAVHAALEATAGEDFSGALTVQVEMSGGTEGDAVASAAIHPALAWGVMQ